MNEIVCSRIASEDGLNQCGQCWLKLVKRIVDFVGESYGHSCIDKGWERFRVWQEKHFDPDSMEASFFMAWFIFHNKKYFDREQRHRDVSEKFFAQIYFDDRDVDCSLLKDVLQRTRPPRPSLLKVVSMEKSQKILHLEDLLLMKHYKTSNWYLFERMKVDQFLFALIVPFEGDLSILLGCSSPVESVHSQKVQKFIEFIDKCSPDFEKSFSEFESDFFNFHFDLISKPRRPLNLSLPSLFRGK